MRYLLALILSFCVVSVSLADAPPVKKDKAKVVKGERPQRGPQHSMRGPRRGLGPEGMMRGPRPQRGPQHSMRGPQRGPQHSMRGPQRGLKHGMKGHCKHHKHHRHHKHGKFQRGHKNFRGMMPILRHWHKPVRA